MKDSHTQEIPLTDNGIPTVTYVDEPDISPEDLQQQFIDAVKDLKEGDELSVGLTEAMQAEIDRLTVNIGDESAKMTEADMDKMMEVLASGKPIITEGILETLQQMVKQPGITTLHYVMKGHDRKPFRGKMLCYAIRSADGDTVTLPKKLRRPNKPMTIVRPLTERRNLFSLSDNFASGPTDERWTNVVTRFSAAYTILNQIVQGMQSEKILQPEDATPDRLDPVLHSEGDSETQETEIISGRVEETTLEDTKD